MTKEKKEAIRLLSGLMFKGKSKEALDMAIKALKQTDALDKIRAIVDDWKADTWTDNLSYECMVKIAELIEPQERSDME